MTSDAGVRSFGMRVFFIFDGLLLFSLGYVIAFPNVQTDERVGWILPVAAVATMFLAALHHAHAAKKKATAGVGVAALGPAAAALLLIVNISLPEAVEQALDTRSSMGVIGDMGRFQQYQMGQAMMAAAENPGGGTAGEGMGLGMGLAMANQMMHGMGQAGAPGMAPPPPPSQMWHVASNGQTLGPYTGQQVAEGIGGGRINGETMVWTQGMAGWEPAGQVPALAGQFGAASPPPPPTAG